MDRLEGENNPEYIFRLKKELERLRYHEAWTMGLWATDRPDLIPESVKDLFFQITFDETEVVTAWPLNISFAQVVRKKWIIMLNRKFDW